MISGSSSITQQATGPQDPCSRSARGYAGRCPRPRSPCSCSRSARGHPQACAPTLGRAVATALPGPGMPGGHVTALPARGPACLESPTPAGGGLAGGLACRLTCRRPASLHPHMLADARAPAFLAGSQSLRIWLCEYEDDAVSSCFPESNGWQMPRVPGSRPSRGYDRSKKRRR